MSTSFTTTAASLARRAGSYLLTRHGAAQAMLAGTAILTTAYAAQAAGGDDTSKLRAQVAAMKHDVAELKVAARVHAATLEQRQAVLAAAISGQGDPDKLLGQIPAAAVKPDVAAAVAVPYAKAEANQAKLAEEAQAALDKRLALTARHLRVLGVKPGRVVQGGMGGPFEPVEAGVVPTASDATTAATVPMTTAPSDAQFRALFQTWKKLDTLEQTVIAIPSAQPVANLVFTSNFGVRSDPFRGVAAMHAGVDIPGPIGTPIYATADGIIGRAERSGGYGNLVEVNHGKGIETRYGHLSKILVQPNTRVRRGQLIGLMGSTGRSTGSHLHYEVRVDGRAVNPVPYLQTASTMQSIQSKTLATTPIAMGGPASGGR